MKRIKYKKPPNLGVHRYVVTIGGTVGNVWKTKYYYVMTGADLIVLKHKVKKGQVLEIYKTVHKFVSAWTKE